MISFKMRQEEEKWIRIMMNPNRPELAITEVGLWVFEKFLFLFIYSFIFSKSVCIYIC